jgi:hypothetical protein
MPGTPQIAGGTTAQASAKQEPAEKTSAFQEQVGVRPRVCR